MLRRESHSACYPNRGLQSLLAEQFYSCSVCRRNTEYGKWLVSQKGRFSDQLEQWNRIVAINPPTCDPYIFYGKMMATLEDTKNPPNFALSAQGLRTVSRAMAKGAQRAIIQDPMKNDAMTKNAAEASRGVAEQLANAAMLLASFPLPGESPSAVEKGLFDLAKLWDESNIVPGVTEEDLHADVATKTAAVRKAILEAMHMLKVAKKPLPCAPIPRTAIRSSVLHHSQTLAPQAMYACMHSQVRDG